MNMVRIMHALHEVQNRDVSCFEFPGTELCIEEPILGPANGTGL